MIRSVRERATFDVRSSGSAIRSFRLDDASPGVNATEQFFYRLGEDGRVEWVVSRLCDHANGKLVLAPDGCTATCPLHGWRLSTQSLDYENVQVRKARLPFVQRGATVEVQDEKRALAFPASLGLGRPIEASVRFLAHASAHISLAGVSIITDPWLVGPCFTTGWWHKPPPPDDALELLAGADFVYLSHNHPDHLHAETLSRLDKDTAFLIPPFASNSVPPLLEQLGFENIFPLKFGFVYELNGRGVFVSILPPGDFRDDSGLLVAGGDFSALFTVDTNRLNNFVLPSPVSLLMTAFAGGATGYPLCFENYSEEQKRAILTRNRNSVLSLAERYVRETSPVAYAPYAGYFLEAAPRDAYIRENNAKNSAAAAVEYISRAHPGVHCVDPTVTDRLRWSKGALTADRSGRAPLFEVDPAYIADWVARLDARPRPGEQRIVEAYFRRAAFTDELVLYLVPTKDDFTPSSEVWGAVVDFRGPSPSVEAAPAAEVDARYDEEARAAAERGVRRKRIRARVGSLLRVLREGLPWEDLSIGFQCRIHRTPDVYNSAFWQHFTNVHIGDKAGVEL